MEQKEKWKSITGTACVLSLVSTMSFNGTMLVNGNCEMPRAHYCYYDETSSNPLTKATNNIYIQETSTQLEEEAKKLFGIMRDATKEEQESVSNYINSIAIDTGVNFFDLC